MRTVKQINFHASFLPWFSLSIVYCSSRKKSSYGSPSHSSDQPSRGRRQEGGDFRSAPLSPEGPGSLLLVWDSVRSLQGWEKEWRCLRAEGTLCWASPQGKRERTLPEPA